MWELVAAGGGLDLNSSYCYLMLARRFAETSVVAEQHGKLAGFVVGYQPPDDPSALFVWQIGVAAAGRGRGLGSAMLDWLVARRPANVTHLEATVTASNTASQRLFRGLARDHGIACDVGPWIAADDFPDDGHEAEDLFRIGPLPPAGQPRRSRATAVSAS